NGRMRQQGKLIDHPRPDLSRLQRQQRMPDAMCCCFGVLQISVSSATAGWANGRLSIFERRFAVKLCHTQRFLIFTNAPGVAQRPPAEEGWHEHSQPNHGLGQNKLCSKYAT